MIYRDTRSVRKSNHRATRPHTPRDLHRRTPRAVRCRADLPRAERAWPCHLAQHLLRRQEQATIGPSDPRRRAGRPHQAHPHHQLRRLRRPQSLAATAARGPPGRAVHGRAPDARSGPARSPPGQEDPHHHRRSSGRPTSSSGTSPRLGRTRSGSPTSPMFTPGAESSTSPSSSTCTLVRSSAGRPRRPSAPTWCWTPWTPWTWRRGRGRRSWRCAWLPRAK